MWKYITPFLFYAVLAGLFMVGEVLMDLVQPGLMSRIVDDGVLGPQAGGYGAMVAERGMSLSGGQKQRLSIARAVVKPAEILIFDDSTSALDLQTEAKLYEALGRSRQGTTKIIIAHRLSTIRDADIIVVMDQGQIVESGHRAGYIAGVTGEREHRAN